jgi:sec-independent protein translocase protein TatA
MMGFTSIWHWVIVLIIVVILFGGRGKLSSLMGDLGTGLRNFKRGMNKEDEDLNNVDSKQIEGVVDISSDSKTEQKENISQKKH